MKRFVTIIILLYSSASFAQRKVEEKFNSKHLGDTARCTIWLPDNWDRKQKYTTIYTFNYGASDAKFIAEQINYINRLEVSNLPPIIVVDIYASIDLIGYNYDSGELTELGNKMLNCIKNEIIPMLNKKYNASKFRTYIGQSYGASYGNYLFLKQPDIFSGYMLMSPERLTPTQPTFEISSELQNFYSHRRSFYFLASGALDFQIRREYAKEVSEEISKLNSSYFTFKYENVSFAGHNNSLSTALPIALDCIYEQYAAYPKTSGTETILSLIKQYENKLSEVYGTGIDKNKSFDFYMTLLPKIWSGNDRVGLIDAINYFITKNSDVRTLRDFAYSCSVVGLNERAKQLYKEAVQKGIENQNSPNFRPTYLIVSYVELASLMEDSDEGYGLLQKALHICLKNRQNIYVGYYPNIYYFMGKFSAEKNYKVQEGIEYLKKIIEKRKDVVSLNRLPLDKIYYYLGKNYTLLQDKQNGKIYLKKAIDANPENKSAKDLLQTLK